MNRIIQIIIESMILLIFVGCSSTTIFIDEQTDLADYSNVEWAITKSDSIIDFRKSKNGCAEIRSNIIIETTRNDSVKKYYVSEFKSIYANKEIGVTSYMIGGIVVTASVIALLLGGINISGG